MIRHAIDNIILKYLITKSQMSKQQLQSIPIFLCHLFKILHDPSLREILQWDQQRKGFLIKDHNRLCEEVLAKFYRHRNFSSFIRQLNMYGFKKVRSKNQYSFFFNQQFDINNQFQQLKNIKRKVGFKKAEKQNEPDHQEGICIGTKKRTVLFQQVEFDIEQAEQKMVKALKDVSNDKDVAKKIIQMKRKSGLKNYLRDDYFIEKVCRQAGVKKPHEEQCLSQLSIQEELNGDKKSFYMESMKLLESGRVIRTDENEDLML